ncbi:hypothetical protein G6F58_013260 [Rhizopus delemar]|nr:hypothetical protein G6F58_013260 [Rhizopus delemar]
MPVPVATRQLRIGTADLLQFFDADFGDLQRHARRRNALLVHRAQQKVGVGVVLKIFRRHVDADVETGGVAQPARQIVQGDLRHHAGQFAAQPHLFGQRHEQRRRHRRPVAPAPARQGLEIGRAHG